MSEINPSITTNVLNQALTPRRRKRYHAHHKKGQAIPASMSDNFYLNHPDLTLGQKKYLGNICGVYSNEHMRKALQNAFVNQVYYEMNKGIIRGVDWDKYLEYITDPTKRKQQFQKGGAKLKKTKPPKGGYAYSYYRHHPVDLPLPQLPAAVKEHLQRKQAVPERSVTPTPRTPRKRKAKPTPSPRERRESHDVASLAEAFDEFQVVAEEPIKESAAAVEGDSDKLENTAEVFTNNDDDNNPPPPSIVVVEHHEESVAMDEDGGSLSSRSSMSSRSSRSSISRQSSFGNDRNDGLYLDYNGEVLSASSSCDKFEEIFSDGYSSNTFTGSGSSSTNGDGFPTIEEVAAAMPPSEGITRPKSRIGVRRRKMSSD